MKLRRRRYIVNAGFQWKFVLGFVTASLMASVISTVLFNLFSITRLEELQWSVHISEQSTGEMLTPLFLYFNLFNIIFVSVLFVITGVWMMKKVKGPLYHIIQYLKRIKEQDFSTHLHLRQKDELWDVVIALRNMHDKIKKRFSRFKAEYEKISKALVEFEIAHARGIPAKKKEKTVIDMLRKLQKEMSKGSVQT